MRLARLRLSRVSLRCVEDDRATGSRQALAQSLAMHGVVAFNHGRTDEAEVAAEEGLALSQSLHMAPYEVRNRMVLGRIAETRSKPDAAAVHLRRALHLARSIDDREVSQIEEALRGLAGSE